MKEEELVKLAQQGDKEAVESILERYKNAVRSRARQFFLVGGETEDLIQEGMVGLYAAIRDYKQDREQKLSFKNFAYLCISRRIIDAVKGAARQKNLPLNNYISIFTPDFEIAEEETVDEQLIRLEDKSEFFSHISKVLSDFEFRVVIMYMDGMSYSQIAEATNKDIKSIDNAISRSKKKLSSMIKEK